jgi:PBP1b-binding outer membrane lipoprotein LpoB
MKVQMKCLATSTALVAALFLGACSHGNKKTEAQAAPPTAHDQAVTQLQVDRDAYVNSTDAKLNQYKQHADALRTRSASVQKPMNKKLQNAAEDLDSSVKDVQAALEEVKQAAPQNWLDYKRDVEKAVNRADAQFANSTSLLQ